MILTVDNNNSYNTYLKNKNKGQWFVWFYADWCGHCKMMEEEWNKLEKSNNTSINLVRINDNYVKPSDNIQGFPTLKLINSSKKKQASGNHSNIVDYNSGRDENSFLDFLKENEKKKVKKPSRTKSRTRTKNKAPKRKTSRRGSRKQK